MDNRHLRDNQLLNTLDLINPYIIGLWRFRVAGEPRKWCVTYAFRGQYFDTQPHESKLDALRDALSTIDKLREKYGECPLATLTEDGGITIEELEALKGNPNDSSPR